MRERTLTMPQARPFQALLPGSSLSPYRQTSAIAVTLHDKYNLTVRVDLSQVGRSMRLKQLPLFNLRYEPKNL